MSITLDFDTSTDTSGANSDDITFPFQNPIKLGNLNWEVALLKVNCWYSVYNVVSQTFEYSHNSGSTFTTVSLPDGLYTVADFNAGLHAEMQANGHWDSVNEEYYINLVANYATGKVYLEIKDANYQFRVANNNIPTLLGFDAGTYTTSQYGENIPDINLGVDLFVVNCDLVDGSYANGKQAQQLFKFTPNSPAYSNIEIEPINPMYLQVNKSTITSIRLWMTDQAGNRLNFNTEDIQYQLQLRPRQ